MPRNDNDQTVLIMNYQYLDEQNREIGPVSIENLKAFRVAGVIKDHTLVRAESGGAWTACVAVVGAVEPAATASTKSAAEKAVTDAVGDAKAALTFLLTNPVGGLAPAYQKLGPKRAGAAGIVFLVVAMVVIVLLVDRSAASVGLSLFGSGGFAKMLFATAGSLAAWVAALAVARLVNQRGGQWEGDAFIAGAMSLVWALGLLLTTIVGWKNFEVCGIFALAAGCITVLQIFVGLTRISNLTEPRATLAVPLILVAGAWLTKIIVTAIFG